jgi:Leucine-rich repeat (LRR) protein
VVCFNRDDFKGIYNSFSDAYSLNVSNKSIKCLDPLALNDYFRIHELILSSNLLTEIPLDCLNNAISIQDELNLIILLDLSYNLIGSLNLTLLTNKLQYLNLSHNKLMSIDDNTFVNVPSLIELDLSFNQIQTITVDTFASLNNLTRLVLSSNKLVNLVGNSFATLINLVTLSLDFNQINQIQTDAFTGLDQLKMLNLSNNFL